MTKYSPQAQGAIIPTLDGWRAVSIAIVVLSHAGLGHYVPGNMGVSVFFFLSVFLITSLCLAEVRLAGHLGIRKFYVRRLIRLYPPLLICLSISYLLYFSGMLDGGFSWVGLASQLFYVANYSMVFFPSHAIVPNGTGVLWSLAVEEHFYVFMPLVFFFFGSPARLKWVGRVFLLLVVLALLWRLALIAAGAGFNRLYYSTDTRFDSILFGCLMAVYWRPVPDFSGRPNSWVGYFPLLVGFALLFVCVAVRDQFFRDSFRYSLIGLGLMPILHFSIRYPSMPVVRWLENAWLKKIGVWSYSIYLIHFSLILAFSKVISSPMVGAVLAILVAILVAALIEKFIDEPSRLIRARFR
jgi:peptidoglycan/LPS O-acetylase OafA/YrhL